MNEIKFRAWDRDYKYMTKKVMVGNVWDEGNYHAHMLWIDTEKVDYECEPDWRHFDENSNIEIMQYTGLKDKNGVEIYEGDIVEVNYNVVPEVKIITYHNASFGIRDNEMGFVPLAIFERPSKKLIVIGNIYENSELLGDSQ